MEKLIVDRFEGDFAVCEKEDLTTINIPRRCLPEGIKEGSIIIKDEAGYSLAGEKEETERRNEIKKLFESLFIEEK